MLSKDQLKKLQEIYGSFRQADRLVCPELNVNNYTEDDVRNMDKAFTNYYHAINEIQLAVGRFLDDVMKE